jgi:hypothetical protein
MKGLQFVSQLDMQADQTGFTKVWQVLIRFEPLECLFAAPRIVVT